MYGKQWANMLAAQQPQPPSVEEFLKIIQDAQKQHGKGEVNDPLYGDMFAGVSGKPTNTQNVQRGAMKLALEFAQACTTNNAVYGNLDEWFVALAKFVLIPEVLEDDKEKQRAIVEHRDRIRPQGMQQRKLQTQSLTTVMNALAALVRHSSTAHAMVISCKTQFPKYNEFLQGCIDRHKVLQAVSEAGKEDVDILQDEEVLKIYNATNFAHTFETHKFNILIIAHRTGLRADTLSKLRRDSFKVGVLSDGRKFM